MPRAPLSLVAFLVALPHAALAQHAPGAVIDDAVTIDVTANGLNAFVPIAEDFVPPSFEVPYLYASSPLDPGADDPTDPFSPCSGWWNFNTCWEYSVSNGSASIGLSNTQITPANGLVNAGTNLNVAVNAPTDPMLLYARGKQCTGLFDCPLGLTQNCQVWVDPFTVPVSTAVQLDYNSFNGQATADILPLQYSLTDLTTDKINVEGCEVDLIQDIAGFIGVDIYQLVIDQVTPILDDQVDLIVDDLNNTLQPMLQDAVNAATVAMTFEVLGIPFDIDVAPQDVQVTPGGVRIIMAGSIDAPADPCVAEFGIDGSLQTSSSPDPIGTAPSGIPAPHVMVQADDDLLNQGMFAVWNSGLLCYTIDDTTEGLPLAINTDLLGLVAPGAFDELFGDDTAPLLIKTRPTQPPVATLDGPNDIDIHVEGLGLDLYAEVDGRMSRILGVDLSADAGANVAFDPVTGTIDLQIDFSTEYIGAQVVFNEFNPSANPAIESSLLGLVDSLAGPILADLVSDQQFAIPSFEGIGLASANVSPAAGAPDRLGVYGNVGYVSYTGGCESGGCGDGAGSGCGEDSSCSSGKAPGRALLFALPLVLAGLRRRQR